MINRNLLIQLFIHITLMIGAYHLLLHFEVFSAVPNHSNLLHWDGEFYHKIMAEGYEYIPYLGSNMAFFPLFSLLWKLSTFSPVSISIFNLLLFSVSLVWLLKAEQVNSLLPLFLLSLGPMIFFALPYPEALFFLCATAISLGYKFDNQLLKNAGFLFASMTKVAAIIFIPAIVITELYFLYGRELNHRIAIRIAFSALACFIGTLIASMVQGFQTGKWFYYLEMQQYWGRNWILPEIPIHAPVAFDGIAWTIGLIAIYISLKFLWARLMPVLKHRADSLGIDQAVCFSVLYLSATVILDTCYTYNTGGANIWSINRHLFCTPFAVIFIFWLIRYFKGIQADYFAILVVVLLGYYFADSFRDLERIICYSLFFIALAIFKFDLKQRYMPLLIVIYVLSCYLQLKYYHSFLSGHWIG